MSQSIATTVSLGAPPRRCRGDTVLSQTPEVNNGQIPGGVGTSQSARFGESSDWETNEMQRQRELEEARARASQMEKTMKWWSDCTANWREKWSKVRTERNKARDEAKQLRSSLEATIKEANSYKREKSELEKQISQLKKEMENIHMLLMKHAGQFDKNAPSVAEDPDGGGSGGRDNDSPDVSSDGLKNVNSEDGLVNKNDCNQCRDSDIEGCVLQGTISKLPNREDNDDHSAAERRLIQQLSKEEPNDVEYYHQKISILTSHLDEAYKSLEREREDKLGCQKNIEILTIEIQDVKTKYEELRLSKQDAVRELLTLQEQHRAEVRISHNVLQEEVNARESLERRLCELRGELERMQAENAVEWGKRERLETEKLILERDNKKIRGELREFQERVDRRSRPPLPLDIEVRNLQQELAEKNKEISELRHSHGKLKKLLAESNTELGHAGRRAEQYESEVKRLRARIEELKRELVRVEDELDAACSHVKRLQRTNEAFAGGEAAQLLTRHSNSPTQQAYYSPSHKPNINDLRQLFDDSKRKNDYQGYISGKGCSSQIVEGKTLPQSLYYDAKGTFIDGENFFVDGPRQKNNMFDFERAKQKFDKSEKSGGKCGGGGNRNSSGQGKNKLSESCSTELGISGISKQNFNETVQFFDENMRKKDAYMKTSLNLDGLKVSDDETP